MNVLQLLSGVNLIGFVVSISCGLLEPVRSDKFSNSGQYNVRRSGRLGRRQAGAQVK